MSWKKRGRKGWTGKKTAKNDTKGRERQYANQEIRQQIQEDFEGDDFRYNGGKKKKNEIASLEHWRDHWLKRALECEIREEKEKRIGWMSSFKCKEWAREYQEKIDDLKKK
jgi:hypothetical protein